jgi:multidrug efflux pump subunit AcrA (membrane-fusion protein)
VPFGSKYSYFEGISMKKLLLSLAAVLVLAVVVYFAFFRGGSTKYEFRFDKATQGDITMTVTATGTISAVITVEVGTQVSGIVQKLYADFNSIVKEGQLIAQIDPRASRERKHRRPMRNGYSIGRSPFSKRTLNPRSTTTPH